MNLKRIFLDMDGVMADFDSHFPDVFELDHRPLPKKEMWKHINMCPNFFSDIPPCIGAIAAYKQHLHNYYPMLLTACPSSNYAHVAEQKKIWARKYLGDITVLPVNGSENKVLFMQNPGDILIDDWRKNTDAWTAAGGVSILHRNWPDTIALFEQEMSKDDNGVFLP